MVFTICSSCSVETKPSLVFSFLSLSQFQRNLSHVVPFPAQLLRDSASWIFSLVLTKFSHQQFSSVPSSPFSPFFFSWFVFFIFFFFVFFFSCHCALFSVKAGWAQWWRRGRIHHNRPPAPQSPPLRNCSSSSWFVASLLVSSRPLEGQVVFVWVVWDWLKQFMGQGDI